MGPGCGLRGPDRGGDGLTRVTEVLARHTSPDGALTILVQRDTQPGGDSILSLGFEGFDWHVHPGEFYPRDGRSDEEVFLEIVSDVVSDRMIIMLQGHDDGPMWPSILDTVTFEVDFYHPGERWSFRFWSGRTVDVDKLMDGRVKYKPFGDAGMTGDT